MQTTFISLDLKATGTYLHAFLWFQVQLPPNPPRRVDLIEMKQYLYSKNIRLNI